MGWIENIIRDWKTKRWIKKHNKIADDAVQYLSSVGWHGFTGHDKEGRKWIVTGKLYDQDYKAILICSIIIIARIIYEVMK